MKKFLSKKTIVFLVAIFATFFCFYHFNYQSNDGESISQELDPSIIIMDSEKDYLELGGFTLLVNQQGEVDLFEDYYGQMLLETPQDILTVSFGNNTDDEELFILKMFYDFEELSFRVGDGDYDTEFVFYLDGGQTIEIPVQLDSNISRDDYSHNLTVGIYEAPDRYAKTNNVMSNMFGIMLNFEVFYESEGDFLLFNKYQNNMKSLNELQFHGLMINNDFVNFDMAYFPPNPLKGKPGEELKLGFLANASELTDEVLENYVIVSMLDWNQIKMDEQSYLFIDTAKSIDESEVVEHGVFYITLPDEVGLYEFVSFIVPNPSNHNSNENFFLLDTAYRFTIEVCE